MEVYTNVLQLMTTPKELRRLADEAEQLIRDYEITPYPSQTSDLSINVVSVFGGMDFKISLVIDKKQYLEDLLEDNEDNLNND